MPKTYLPVVIERVVVVVQSTESQCIVHEFSETASGIHAYVGERRIGAFSAKPILDMWKADLARLGDRRATWQFTETTVGVATCLIARAVPSHLTRSDRVDLLLSAIFQASCRAAIRGNRDEVARLDDRYAAVELAFYGTVGDADRVAAAKRTRLSTALTR